MYDVEEMISNDSEPERLLMIYVKNCEIGKVKTRLAKSVGNENALAIYKKLLEHTRDVALIANCTPMIYYSEYVEYQDVFSDKRFLKDEQVEGDLGIRLLNSFKENFREGQQKIVCIGSDCLEIEAADIDRAFSTLDDRDLVLGPARDGGYYLIGLSREIPELFENMAWSTNNLLLDTILKAKNLGLEYELLETKSDIDFVEDLNDELKELIGLSQA